MAVVAVLTSITVVAPFFGRPALVRLVDAGSLATVVAYLLVAVAFLVIRRRYPDLPRPYRIAAPSLVGWLAVAATVFFILASTGQPVGARLAGGVGHRAAVDGVGRRAGRRNAAPTTGARRRRDTGADDSRGACESAPIRGLGFRHAYQDRP